MYLVDACQTVGQYPIDVKKFHCDFLSAASRKYLRGPRGCGFLFVREEVLNNTFVNNNTQEDKFFAEPPTIDHASAPWTSRNEYSLLKSAKRYEKWENSPCIRLAMGEAIRYALDRIPGGIQTIWQRIQFLANDLRSKLRKIGADKIELCDIGDEKKLCGLVTFRAKGLDCVRVKDFLRQRAGINVVVSTQNVTRLDMEERNLVNVNRASLHYFNTIQEIDKFVEVMSKIHLFVDPSGFIEKVPAASKL